MNVKRYLIYISIALLVGFGVWGIINFRSKNADSHPQQSRKELIVNKWKFD